MIKVENLEVFGIGAAVRGMRNPLSSWAKSDSVGNIVGYDDLALMRRLFHAGPEHRKYLRQISIVMDITAPLYFWKEFDTYKLGTTSNSTSTMHTIHKHEFKLDDFSTDHLCDDYLFALQRLIKTLNDAREQYILSGDKDYWWQMIQLLPTSYNQLRTVSMNYEVAYRIICQRSGHKLDEWRSFVELMKNLPLMPQLMSEENSDKIDNKTQE